MGDSGMGYLWVGPLITAAELAAETIITNRLIQHVVIVMLKMTIIIISVMIKDLAPFIGVLVGIISVIAGVSAGIRWLVRHYFDDIKHELKPNSGTSIKDQVTRLERSHEKLEDKVDKIFETLLDFISKNK